MREREREREKRKQAMTRCNHSQDHVPQQPTSFIGPYVSITSSNPYQYINPLMRSETSSSDWIPKAPSLDFVTLGTKPSMFESLGDISNTVVLQKSLGFSSSTDLPVFEKQNPCLPHSPLYNDTMYNASLT
jgi:hypothetical protein